MFKKLSIPFFVALLGAGSVFADTAAPVVMTSVTTAPTVTADKPVATTSTTSTVKPVTTASGLQYLDSVVGTGAVAKSGEKVSVHYTGWLDNAGQKGNKFDSSVDRGQPFEFALGAGQVIKGWDEGVSGMKVGGKRTLMIPADLAYGARGAGGAIPPNAKLIFDVELLGVN